jgi:hypothetical protein
MQIVCDFSAADGFRRDADIQREAQPQTRPRRRRSKLRVLQCRRLYRHLSLGRPSLPELAGCARGGGTAAIGQ